MITEQNFNGFLAFVFFAAVPVAVVLGVIIRARYRKAIAREMMLVTESSAEAFSVPEATHPNHSSFVFETVSKPDRPPLRIDLAVRYLLAGFAYSYVMVVLLFLSDGIAFLPVRTLVVLASFVTPAMIMAIYVSGLRWYWNVLFFVFWTWLLFVIAPESNDVIGMLVGPAFMLSLVVGNPALRTTAIPLFLVAVSLVVPFVFSLDFLYLILVAGLLDSFLSILPSALVTVVYVIIAVGFALAVGVVFSLLAVRLVAWMTENSSEYTMQHDLLWLFQTIWMVGLGWGTNGALVLVYFFAFVAYRLVLWGMSPKNQAKEISLLLRVFGQRGTQTSLARGLLLDWRRTGPVLLIGGADLATETLDAPELAAFLSRRLKNIFINSPEDLLRVESAGEARLSDGLFPMRDYYCRDNSWRPTILTLMSTAQRVLVDMRGYHETNEGIIYEINALAERVASNNIVVIVDAASLKKVENIFAEAWSDADRAPGQDRIRCIIGQ